MFTDIPRLHACDAAPSVHDRAHENYDIEAVETGGQAPVDPYLRNVRASLDNAASQEMRCLIVACQSACRSPTVGNAFVVSQAEVELLVMDKTSRTQADSGVGGLSNQHVNIVSTNHERVNRNIEAVIATTSPTFDGAQGAGGPSGNIEELVGDLFIPGFQAVGATCNGVGTRGADSLTPGRVLVRMLAMDERNIPHSRLRCRRCTRASQTGQPLTCRGT